MALPINIQKLLQGRSVEWERLEFKTGWNPEDVLHTLCAFANDLNNWGGGYLFIGIAEKDGRPELPPAGLQPEQVDSIQKKIRELCHQLQPHYFPVVQPEEIEGQIVLVFWAPAGDQRIYTAPKKLGEKLSPRLPYIRHNSSTVEAKGEQLKKLQQLSRRIPFDDRINHQAELQDLSLSLIREYLDRTKSRLAEELARISFEELCRQMRIVGGPPEHQRPLNIGLLLFSHEPESFFDRAWIEVVIHDEEQKRSFTEKMFKGPVHRQLENALQYLQSLVIREKVTKIPGQAEAQRVFNFPYEAVEEALANAVYHRDYEERKPVEVQVWPSREMTILSYPGPLPPTSPEDLNKRRLVARDYRNRRLGDYLKELGLTEGRATGLPLIRDRMEANGSPEPNFETDKDRTYFLVTLPAHEAFKEEAKATAGQLVLPASIISWQQVDELLEQLTWRTIQSGLSAEDADLSNLEIRSYVRNQVNDQVDDEVSDQVYDQVHDQAHTPQVLELALEQKKRAELLKGIGKSNHTDNSRRYIEPLLEEGLLELTIPDKPQSSKQEIKTTLKGLILLQILKQAKHGKE
jgi:ATP-dependent DNA helicase RecG